MIFQMGSSFISEMVALAKQHLVVSFVTYRTDGRLDCLADNESSVSSLFIGDNFIVSPQVSHNASVFNNSA